MTDQIIKADTGKSQLHLVPMQISRDIAGSILCGMLMPRLAMLAFVEDPRSCDAESETPHYRHMTCNMAFICEIMRDGKKGIKSQYN